MEDKFVLFNDIIYELNRIKPWINAEYYKNNIIPLIDRIRNANSSISFEQPNSKKEKYNTEPAELKNNINDNTFQDTVPTRLIEKLSMFGVFENLIDNKDNLTRGRFCKNHPGAPHMELKELSAAMDRYVCKCEFWSPNY